MEEQMPVHVKELDPDQLFKKHTAAIHIKSTLNAADYKLQNILYKCAWETDQFNSQEYYINFSDIRKYMGWDQIKIKDLKAIVEKLNTTLITWNIFQQDRKNDEEWNIYGGTTLISSHVIHGPQRIMKFSITNDIQKMLRNPNIFAYIDLKVQKKLSTKSQIIIYEYFVEELHRNKADTIQRWYSVADIKRMLNIAQNEYPVFRELRRSIIKPALEVINKETNISAEVVDEFKQDRFVTSLKFKISFKEPVNRDDQQELPLLDDNSDAILNAPDYDVFLELRQFFTEKAATAIIQETKEKRPMQYLEYIRTQLEYAKRFDAKGQIKVSLEGLIRKSIDEDYASYDKKMKAAAAKATQDALRREREDQERKLENKQRETEYKAEKMIASMSEDERDKLAKECAAAVKGYKLLPEKLQMKTLVGYVADKLVAAALVKK